MFAALSAHVRLKLYIITSDVLRFSNPNLLLLQRSWYVGRNFAGKLEIAPSQKIFFMCVSKLNFAAKPVFSQSLCSSQFDVNMLGERNRSAFGC